MFLHEFSKWLAHPVETCDKPVKWSLWAQEALRPTSHKQLWHPLQSDEWDVIFSLILVVWNKKNVLSCFKGKMAFKNWELPDLKLVLALVRSNHKYVVFFMRVFEVVSYSWHCHLKDRSASKWPILEWEFPTSHYLPSIQNSPCAFARMLGWGSGQLVLW